MITFASDARNNINLLMELSKREFGSGFRGTSIKAYWSILQPLVLLSVYTLAFSSILSDRWGNSGSIESFVFSLFMGLIIYTSFADVSAKSVRIIYGNPNYVKKVVFPIALLPVSLVLSSVFQMSISMGVWAFSYIIVFKVFPYGVIIYPLVLVSYAIFLSSVAIFLSLAGVVIKDLQHVVALLNHCLLFLSPIFFRAEDAPGILKKILYLNPLTPLIESSRNIMMDGDWGSIRLLMAFLVFSIVLLSMVCYCFRKGKPSIADMV